MQVRITDRAFDPQAEMAAFTHHATMPARW